MSDMTWFTLASTVAAVLAIAIGVSLPAFAMGKAISSALEALRLGLPGHDRIAGHLRSGHRAYRFIQEPAAGIFTALARGRNPIERRIII